jgi:Cdc6-like AAA superfamily ATPase
LISRLEPGTGQWLLDSAEYQAWRDADNQALFCLGMPGAGKTMATAIIVNDLANRFSQAPEIGIAYVYCTFKRRNEQQADELLASLLKQLSRGQPSLPGSVKALYHKRGPTEQKLTIEQLSEALRSVAAVYSRVFVAIDALDEALTDCRTRLLVELFRLQSECRVNFFATSRDIPEVTSKFDKGISMEIRASKEDVQRYVQGHIGQLPKFVSRDLKLQEEVEKEITRSAQGM